ncbi:hypothetical protein TSAR_008245, partial [Trichomalopsis sarcophagae]
FSSCFIVAGKTQEQSRAESVDELDSIYWFYNYKLLGDAVCLLPTKSTFDKHGN